MPVVGGSELRDCLLLQPSVGGCSQLGDCAAELQEVPLLAPMLECVRASGNGNREAGESEQWQNKRKAFPEMLSYLFSACLRAQRGLHTHTRSRKEGRGHQIVPIRLSLTFLFILEEKYLALIVLIESFLTNSSCSICFPNLIPKYN